MTSVSPFTFNAGFAYGLSVVPSVPLSVCPLRSILISLSRTTVSPNSTSLFNLIVLVSSSYSAAPGPNTVSRFSWVTGLDITPPAGLNVLSDDSPSLAVFPFTDVPPLPPDTSAFSGIETSASRLL